MYYKSFGGKKAPDIPKERKQNEERNEDKRRNQ